MPPLWNMANGEFVVNDEEKACLLSTIFFSISECAHSNLSTPVLAKTYRT